MRRNATLFFGCKTNCQLISELFFIFVYSYRDDLESLAIDEKQRKLLLLRLETLKLTAEIKEIRGGCIYLILDDFFQNQLIEELMHDLGLDDDVIQDPFNEEVI